MDEAPKTRRGLLRYGAGALASLAAQRGLPIDAMAVSAAPPAGPLPGEVRLFAGDYAPVGWERAPVSLLRDPDGEPDGFPLTHLVAGREAAPLTYLVVADREAALTEMIGEVRAFAFDFAPPGWCPCDGRELGIAEHPNLHAIIGDRFGASAPSRFAVPDLRAFAPVAHCIADAGEFPVQPR